MVTTTGLAVLRAVVALNDVVKLAGKAVVPVVRAALMDAPLRAATVAHAASEDPETRLAVITVARNQTLDIVWHNRCPCDRTAARLR